MKCPNCGASGTGNFCASCGASLQASSCVGCGAALQPNARFCTQCGTPVGGARKARLQPTPRGAGGNLPWYLAGGILLILAIILDVPMLSDSGDAATTASQAPGPMQQPGATAGTPPPLTGTPREQADRLYDRIMREREGGDTARAKFFTPLSWQSCCPPTTRSS